MIRLPSWSPLFLLPPPDRLHRQLDPRANALKFPKAQDSRVNKIPVNEGDKVKTNQVIAILQGIERREADLRDIALSIQKMVA
ncbi:hypothetical protein [Scytonema sp. NUACC21]